MSQYCHIENNVIDEGPKPIPTAWRNISGLHHLDKAKLKALGWLPVRRVGFEPFDPTAQVRTGPDYAIEADEVVATYTVRDKTAQELADDQRTQDVAELRNAGKDAVLLLIELIDWEIANNALDPASFSAPVRQAYQRLKPIADRLIS